MGIVVVGVVVVIVVAVGRRGGLYHSDTAISTTREDVTKLVNTLFFEICRCFCYTRCTSELLVNLHIQSFAELPESSLRVYFGDR